MYQNNACRLNGKHTFYDYGLYVGNANAVSPPEPKTQYIEVPGRNGDIDLTEALSGRTVYKNRTITLQLGGKKPPGEWDQFISDFLNEIHGKMVTVEFDRDPDWYYVGRATVEDDYERGNYIGRFTVKINAEPYKYSRIDRLPELTVDGSASQRAVGSPLRVVPEFVCSAAMTLTLDGKTYDLAEGSNKLTDIVFEDKEYNLTFAGNGTVQVIYKRGRL